MDRLKIALTLVGIGVVVGAVIVLVLTLVFGARPAKISVGPIEFEMPTSTPVTPEPTHTPPLSVSPPPTAMPPSPTFTPVPPTPTPLPPTPKTLLPTFTPVPPTPTLLVLEDTPPGSVLEVGESWRQNGVRLRLDKVDFYAPNECLTLMFNLFNDTGHTIIVTIERENFSVLDNLGRRWQFHDFGYCHYGCGVASLNEKLVDDIEDGESFRTDGCGSWKTMFKGFVTDTSVTEVIVTVDGLSRISNARWRIPVYH